MATVTILNLPGTNTVDATTVAPVVYSGTTYKATLQTLGAFINTNAAAVSASGNITGGNILTGGLISATGNVTGAYIFGNGSQLSGLPALYGNANVVANLAALGSNPINTTGNITGGNIMGGANVNATTHTGVTVSVSGNVTGGNLITSAAVSAASVSASGNVTGGNLNAAGLSLSSNVVSALNATGAIAGANLTTPGLISATGNVTGGNVTTGGLTQTVNLSVSGNVLGSLLPSANVTYDLGSATQRWKDLYLSGTTIQLGGATLSASGTALSMGTGNVTGGNVTTGGLVTATGNITGGNVITSAAVSAASVSASGNVTGGNVNVGNITIATDLISSANAIITIDPATTGNAGLVVINGNLQVNGNTTTINSNVVSTNDLTVNYANNAINSAAANGGGIEVGPIGSPFITWLYNNTANVFTSSGGISAVGNVTGGNLNAAGLSLTSNVVSALNVTGAIAGANVTTPGLISATGNITGGNLITSAAVSAASVSASGNITGGNILGGANVNATTHTGTTVSVSGNITGGNIITSGALSAASLSLSGASQAASYSAGTGNITGGNIVNANGNGVGNIGSSSVYFNTVFAKATSAQYADLAEKYTADAEYTSGTVLSFGGAQEVTITLTDADHRVAGVVSTNPATIMNAGLTGEHVAIVALTGRVPCSVTGQVRKGDSMVSAGNGQARAEANPAVSTVIGKALEDFDGESGTIEIVVGRV